MICSWALSVSGCGVAQGRYYEKHEIKNLTVVFLDEQSLREKYAMLSVKPAVAFSGNGYAVTVKTVRGFFDPLTNTIYCPKMDFEVCGHELHHLAIGPFHSAP